MREYSFTAGDVGPTTTTAAARREGEGEEGGGGKEERKGLFTVGDTDSGSASVLGAPEGGGNVSEGDEGNVSPSRVDEVRQRRLQRFHSMPASPVTDLPAQSGDDKTTAAKSIDKQSDKEQ